MNNRDVIKVRLSLNAQILVEDAFRIGNPMAMFPAYRKDAEIVLAILT